MSSSLSRLKRAKSEIRRKDSYTWSEAAIDIRCRNFLLELDWPWIDGELSNSWTPVEEIHAFSEYPLSEDSLCEVCQQFAISEGIHQRTGASLIKSASDGCQLCSMVLNTFTVNSSEENLEILRQNSNPIILKQRIDDQDMLTAGYAIPIMHNGEARFFKARQSLAVLTGSNAFLV